MKSLINRGKELSTRIMMGFVLSMGAAVPSFAAITNAGQNIGGWIMEQGYALALGIVAAVLVKFLVKKAWVQTVSFILIAAVLLFLISSPEALKSAGQSIFSIINK